VKGIVTITLHLNQGQTLYLEEVLYVSDLKKNLVSIFAMKDKGFKVTFVDGKVHVWKRYLRDAFTLGFRVEGLYQVGRSLLGAMTCDTFLQSELWHRRFSHLHYKALPNIRKIVTSMLEFNLDHEGVCHGCAIGKLMEGPFPSSQSQTTNILQLVHYDLSVMLPMTSLGGFLYYAIFVDDFSCKTWIYFLKKKDEVFKWFRSLKALVKNQTGKKIKILRTDNGTEYESNEFNDYCREVGIKKETTTIYTPEQNGDAERKNRTTIEATRAMLHDQALTKFLWGEAANTAVYVQNRCPHQALDFKTPKEVFIGKKPSVSHFRIFGCPVYFHVPKEKRNKLDASGKK